MSIYEKALDKLICDNFRHLTGDKKVVYLIYQFNFSCRRSHPQVGESHGEAEFSRERESKNHKRAAGTQEEQAIDKYERPGSKDLGFFVYLMEAVGFSFRSAHRKYCNVEDSR